MFSQRLRAYGLHHALSDYYDGPGAPPSPRTLAAVRRSCNVASNYPWTKIDGSLGLSTTAFQLVRSGLQLDYWPPPAVSHRTTKVSLPRSRSRVEVPSPVSLGGLDYMCECLATACVHGCGAIVPYCLEEVRIPHGHGPGPGRWFRHPKGAPDRDRDAGSGIRKGCWTSG